ncbi:ubiquitin-like domain-containing protein [Alicyclobacillus kakegawensis]|uniref:ubiquitin-like domain-containing protein n=1 Tax=Alicyclobacillus kakegawensis TaxID=392012 RepID=UPI000835CACC|nr:ubiquitin-like domain-containing protein [Alicyclobacillus kakegawensis]
MRIPKSKVLYVSAAVLALFGGSAMTADAAYKTVTVQDNGERRVVHGFGFGTVRSFLRRQGVTFTPDDKVVPEPDRPVTDGMEVTVRRAKLVHLVDGGVPRDMQTTALTVGQLLRQSDIEMGKQDIVSKPLHEPLNEGEWVRIYRVETRTSTSRASIPFQTERRMTDQLYEGQQRVLTHGVKGLQEVLTTHKFVDGRKVSTKVTKKVLRRPIHEIVLVGTRERPMVSRSASLASRGGGGTLQFARKLVMTATAYVGGGRTADGSLAEPGVASVDPAVIPLGSRLYVPGVGKLVAADTGGAIHGNRIDICVSTESEALSFGVRPVTVYVLH